MDFDFKMMAGIIAAVVSFIAHPLYIWAVVVKKETRPHLFTWLISAFIAGLSIFLFDKAEGGETIYMLIGDFVGLLIIACISFFYRNRNGRAGSAGDWICLFSAFIGIGIYGIFHNAILAFSAIIFSEVVGLFPTIRKTWQYPEEEDFIAWFFTFVGNLINILAIDFGNAADIVYALTIFVADGIVFYLILNGKIKKIINNLNYRI